MNLRARVAKLETQRTEAAGPLVLLQESDGRYLHDGRILTQQQVDELSARRHTLVVVVEESEWTPA